MLSLSSLVLFVALPVFGRAMTLHTTVPFNSISQLQVARGGAPFQAMSLRNIYVSGDVNEKKISFDVEDVNFNTSTSCNIGWVDLANATTLPTSYQRCDETGGKEAYAWHFESYVSMDSFSLQIIHGYEDPEFFPPPYEYVQVWAKADVSLSCVENGEFKECVLPEGTTSVPAPIYAAIN